MPYLKFNPYFSLPVYSTIKDGAEFPFREGEHVTVRLIFGGPLPVSERRSVEEDLKGTNAKLEADLTPDGEYSGHYVQSEVQQIDGQTSLLLRFTAFEDDMLQALLTAEDQELAFPFKPGQVIRVPLVVKYVQKISPPNPDETWQAILVPEGEKLNGLIVTKVELAAEVPTRHKWHTGDDTASPQRTQN